MAHKSQESFSKMALAIRMSKMTKGSTKAVMESSSSSKKASTKEMMAASSRILTSRSSNCSSTSCSRLLPSSAGNSRDKMVIKNRVNHDGVYLTVSTIFVEVLLDLVGREAAVGVDVEVVQALLVRLHVAVLHGGGGGGVRGRTGPDLQGKGAATEKREKTLETHGLICLKCTLLSGRRLLI